MTLKEAKKKVYGLLDEYSANGEVTVDQDIELRLNSFFDMCQKNLAALAPVRKMITVGEGNFALGGRIIKYLAAYDGAGERIYPKRFANTIIIPAGGASLDVLAIPDDIDEDTPDTYEFEIGEALAAAMPYWVAASLNVVDFAVSPSNLLSQFNAMVGSAVSASSPYAGTVSFI